MKVELILRTAQVFVSLFLIGAILLQAKGVGLSSFFSGGATFYRSKRGLERILFAATIFLSFLFILLSFLDLFYS